MKHPLQIKYSTQYDFRNHLESFGKSIEEMWKTKPSEPLKSSDINDFNIISELEPEKERITDRDMLRKFGSFEDSKDLIDDAYERLKYTATSRDFHHSPPSYHHQPQYHYSPPPAPAPSHPPPYKAVYEVIR